MADKMVAYEKWHAKTVVLSSDGQPETAPVHFHAKERGPCWEALHENTRDNSKASANKIKTLKILIQTPQHLSYLG